MHSYRPPADTFALREAVDTYSGRPVAVTEFAAMSDKDDVMNAVAEAGFMAALERNCHKVRGKGCVGGWRCTPHVGGESG